MTTVISRAYNQFVLDKTNGTISKYSTTDRLLDELSYYRHITEFYPEQQILFPRLLRWNDRPPIYSFTTELYDYPDLGKYLIGDYYLQSWEPVFNSITQIFQCWDNIKLTNNMAVYDETEIHQNAHRMYIDKTETEYYALVKLFADKYPTFNPTMFTSVGYEINDRRCDNFEIIWPQVKSYIEKHLLTYTPVMIHGDCCLSNLLYGSHYGVIRLVDPRGSFGVKGVYGDRRYDLAKLYHSVDGKYEFIINDKFETTCTATRYTLSYSRNDNPGKQEFEDVVLSNYNKKDIKLLQGLLFISMAARHYDSVCRQEIMYFTGISLLNEALML